MEKSYKKILELLVKVIELQKQKKISGIIDILILIDLTEEQAGYRFKKDLEIAIKDVDKLVKDQNINTTVTVY
jgi:hypothetical protein